MSSYIVQESNNKIVRRVGKNLRVDPSPAGGYSEFNVEHMNIAKINNLVFPIGTQERKVKISCTVCQQRCEIMTKQQLVDSYSNLDTEAKHRAIQRVEEECEDGITYAVCTHCGTRHSTLETALVPKYPKSAHVCVKCMNHPDNMGQLKTLKPERMHQIRNDESSSMRWYWSCSMCGYRYLMEYSNLKIQIGAKEQKSFVRSLETIKKKPSIPREDYDDLASLGVPTSLVDSRDILP